MTPGDPATTSKLRPFGTTIFSAMTRLAVEHDAINLAQGFPDFEGPEAIREAAVAALRGGDNQYSRSLGHPALVQALAGAIGRWTGLKLDPWNEIAVVNGATEGIAASILGLLETGDEVILFEPYYDSYHGCVALAGGVPRFATLRFPDFALDEAALESLFNERTRLLVLNTPHNPTGKVFRRDELETIARLCRKHDVLVLADEVYEHIVFDDVDVGDGNGAEHISIATLDGMWERTLTVSSSGKTFSYTGWKIGWVYGPANLVAAAQAAHQFLTFCASTPLQCAIACALEDSGDDVYQELRDGYRRRRDLLLGALTDAGFVPATPAGTYFILADFSGVGGGSFVGDDRAFAEHLVREVGVAAIPPSVFYGADATEGRRLLRFSFSKRRATLEEAAQRLRRLC